MPDGFPSDDELSYTADDTNSMALRCAPELTAAHVSTSNRVLAARTRAVFQVYFLPLARRDSSHANAGKKNVAKTDHSMT